MKRLSEILPNSMPQGFASYSKIKKLWSDCAGDTIAFITTPGSVSEVVLNVAVHDQTWLSEIGFLKGELIQRLKMKGLELDNINFYYKHRKLNDSEIIYPTRKSMTEKEKKFADRLIDTIEDEALRAAFRKAIYGYFTLYTIEDYLNC
ncbi:MAG: hypothetical protein C0602_05165 [Denitrovibrio sp.]|nr:MAG: hypothetical protein C0602_05165 [Denitrovibrio sp.]